MGEHAIAVDEMELIEELLKRRCDDPVRLRCLCELIFGNPDIADRKDLVRTAAIVRRACMRHPLPGEDSVVGRLYQFGDDLTTIEAEIHGGPSRRLLVPAERP